MTPDNLPSASPSLARLVQELNRLPGIGPKSAQRLAYHIIGCRRGSLCPGRGGDCGQAEHRLLRRVQNWHSPQ